MKLLLPVVCAIACIVASCSPKKTEPTAEEQISTDSSVIAMGLAEFKQDCSSCHSIETDGIGPSLAGVTALAPASWLRKFISNPKAMLDEHDQRATELVNQYKTVMPSFAHLTKDKVDGILAYLKTKES